VNDWTRVNCDEAREAISALLDGESPGLELGDLERHIGGCVGCAAWRERAYQLTRRVRVRVVEPARRPPPELMAVVGARRSGDGTQK
jgi:predicted anti-sigma-YlaC factor YlaD